MMGALIKSVVLVLAALSEVTVADRGPQRKRETSKDEKKFCPLEYRNNHCRARKNQFKCGVFFMNLHGQKERLRWIAALPDALVKPSLRNSPILMNSINWVRKKDFTVPRGDCDERSAKSECYDIMSAMTGLSLESCERNLLNEHGRRTLGNVLCEKAGLWVPGQQFQSFVTIGFFHSACGGNWTATSFEGQHLRLEEELCCKFNNGVSSWFRCDGSPYRGTCEEDPTEADVVSLDAKPLTRHERDNDNTASSPQNFWDTLLF